MKESLTCIEYVWVRAQVLTDCVGGPVEPLYFSTLATRPAEPVPELGASFGLLLGLLGLALAWWGTK